MKSVIELAKEAGFDLATILDWDEELFEFAALVRAEREWVDLTDDDIFEANRHSHGNTEWAKKKALASAVIAAFKEKNK